MIEVGDLVRIKRSSNSYIVGKIGVVVHKGTWSRDVYIIDTSKRTRFAKEKLEKL